MVTDYTSINEMVHHGVASDEAEAGVLAVNAGVDLADALVSLFIGSSLYGLLSQCVDFFS